MFDEGIDEYDEWAQEVERCDKQKCVKVSRFLVLLVSALPYTRCDRPSLNTYIGGSGLRLE